MTKSEEAALEKKFYENKELQDALDRVKQQSGDMTLAVPVLLFLLSANKQIPTDDMPEDIKTIIRCMDELVSGV